MNDPNQWRVTLAEKIAPIYAAIPAVQAIVLIGGVARGKGDDYSDLDLALYWERPPTDAERRAAQHQLETILNTPVIYGDLKSHPIQGYPGGNAYLWEEASFIGGDETTGFKIDVTHEQVAVMEWIIDAVTRHFDMHGAKLERLYSIQRVHILHGDDLIRVWQSRARVYPDELAARLITFHLGQLRFDVALHLSRGDMLLFYKALTTAQENLLGALLALNHIYRPECKRLASLCEEMALKPDNLAACINNMLRATPEAAARDFDVLAEETFALIGAHMLGLAVKELTRPFYQRRQAFTHPPISGL